MHSIHTSSTSCRIGGNAGSSYWRRSPIASLYIGETMKLSNSMIRSERVAGKCDHFGCKQKVEIR
uniref:Uncharacterized protein n=1 Tax=Romanomermis culicivorax TaxID=13658 RepID=A0A915HF17_ROMCU